MYTRILVPLDGSATSAAGLREATRLAADTPGATIRLLHVLDEVPALQVEAVMSARVIEKQEEFGEKLLKKAQAQVRRRGVQVEAVCARKITGRTADAIVAEAKKWKAHVIVMGTHGRSAIGRVVMGSNAEAVVRTAPVPVLLVRAARGKA